MRQKSTSLLVALLALLALPPGSASQVVLVEDGRTMPVASAERQGEMVVMELEGGGFIAVPAHRVTNWQELESRRHWIKPLSKDSTLLSWN